MSRGAAGGPEDDEGRERERDLPFDEARLDRLTESIAPVREELLDHDVYDAVADADELSAFLDHHAFVVWTHLSILTALRRDLTGVSLPWVPADDPLLRGLVNELALETESGRTAEGGHASRFERCLDALAACGDEPSVEELVAVIDDGLPLPDALDAVDLPTGVREYVDETWRIVETGESHEAAAALAFAGEDLVPDGFVDDLDLVGDADSRVVRSFLADATPGAGGERAVRTRRLLGLLCGDDEERWHEAEAAAVAALDARRDLLDVTRALVWERTAA